MEKFQEQARASSPTNNTTKVTNVVVTASVAPTAPVATSTSNGTAGHSPKASGNGLFSQLKNALSKNPNPNDKKELPDMFAGTVRFDNQKNTFEVNGEERMIEETNENLSTLTSVVDSNQSFVTAKSDQSNTSISSTSTGDTVVNNQLLNQDFDYSDDKNPFNKNGQDEDLLNRGNFDDETLFSPHEMNPVLDSAQSNTLPNSSNATTTTSASADNNSHVIINLGDDDGVFSSISSTRRQSPLQQQQSTLTTINGSSVDSLNAETLTLKRNHTDSDTNLMDHAHGHHTDEYHSVKTQEPFTPLKRRSLFSSKKAKETQQNRSDRLKQQSAAQRLAAEQAKLAAANTGTNTGTNTGNAGGTTNTGNPPVEIPPVGNPPVPPVNTPKKSHCLSNTLGITFGVAAGAGAGYGAYKFLPKLFEKVLPKLADNIIAIAVGAALIGLVVAAIVGVSSKFAIDKISECSSNKGKA